MCCLAGGGAGVEEDDADGGERHTQRLGRTESGARAGLGGWPQLEREGETR